jgi:hypothetical protein
MITSVNHYAVDESIIEAEVWMLRSAATPNPTSKRTMQTITTSKRQAGPPVRHDFPPQNGQNLNQRSLD